MVSDHLINHFNWHVQFNGLFERSSWMLEISLKVFGRVFKELFWRYKEDNWGNLENKFGGKDWILLEDKSRIWRLFRLDKEFIDERELDERFKIIVDGGNWSSKNSLVSWWFVQVIVVKSDEQIQDFVDEHWSVNEYWIRQNIGIR